MSDSSRYATFLPEIRTQAATQGPHQLDDF